MRLSYASFKVSSGSWHGHQDLDRDPAQVGPVGSERPAHLLGPRGDVGQAHVVAAARSWYLALDDLPERLRLPAPVVRDAERDHATHVAQPDDHAMRLAVHGRVEDALAGHLE